MSTPIEHSALRMPEVGDAAPDFKLPTPEGPEIGLADYRGRRRLVLWFSKGLF